MTDTEAMAVPANDTDAPSALSEGFGWRAWGLGIVVIGVVGLALGDFHPSLAVPRAVPERQLLSFVVNGLLVVGGLAMQGRRLTVPVVLALAVVWGVVAPALHVWAALRHPEVFASWCFIAEPVALAAAGLVVVGRRAIEPERARRLVRVGQVAFGLCAIAFGAAHFVYPTETAALAPGWLPPSAVFWAWATGVFHVAGGVAIIARVQARLAAWLLTAMYAAFTPLVHIPTLFADPHRPFFWTENAINLALIASAWVVAESFGRGRSRGRLARGAPVVPR